MPYASEAQRRYMHARHPEIAARWDAEGKGHVEAKMTTGAGSTATTNQDSKVRDVKVRPQARSKPKRRPRAKGY